MKIEIKKEIANSVTHGIGLLTFISLLPFLFIKAAAYKVDYRITGLILFSVGLIAVYTSSTLYHAIMKEKAKRLLRIFDHISIYYLIAGSYSAFMLQFIPQRIAVPFLVIMWILVLLGTVKKIFLTGKYDRISTFIYVFMGCMGLFIADHLFRYVPGHVLWLIFSGGAAYLLGVIFYAWKRYTYHHAVWHVFVFTGSMCHFWALYYGFA